MPDDLTRPHARMLKIISGGQTGVDRAALDAALEFGIPCGGWCPKGRLAEDGRIPDRYPLTEMPTTDYPARTRKNVEVADWTLILTRGPLTGGTRLTERLAKELGRSSSVVDLDRNTSASSLVRWLFVAGDVEVLNVAGPRESKCPGIYARSKAFLLEVFRLAKEQLSQ